MKKVLIFGCGSIGQRHIKALKKIDDIALAVCRTKKGFHKELDLGSIEEFSSEQNAFSWKPDYMIISNPTSLHLEYLFKAIDNGVKNIFVEKPLASNFTEIEKVSQGLDSYKSNIAVGFNLRFHPITKELKEIIGSRRYGKVLKASLKVGSYLPFWHPYEDYRETYVAKKELGGGALRTLCHEIDLAQCFFGQFKSVCGLVSKISNLEIDTDDNAFILADMVDNLKVEIKMDLLRPIPERKGEILFEKGLLRYNFNQLNIEYVSYQEKTWNKVFSLDKYDYDSQYQDQMRDFINNDYSQLCTFQEAKAVNKVIDLAERSQEKRKLYV